MDRREDSRIATVAVSAAFSATVLAMLFGGSFAGLTGVIVIAALVVAGVIGAGYGIAYRAALLERRKSAVSAPTDTALPSPASAA
jgi:hypothetical protein